MSEFRKIDALGDQCPIPVVKTKKALDEMGKDEWWRPMWIMKSRCRT